MFHFDIKNDVKGLNHEYIITTFAEMSKTLGPKRVAVVEFINKCITVSSYLRRKLPITLKKNNFFTLLLDYYFSFEWCNIYQISCNELFTYLIENQSDNEEMLNFLTYEFNILDEIVDRVIYSEKFTYSM